jgi:hypothetical protein
MIRSQHHSVTIVDKALYLWVLCTIEWMHERQEPISNNNLTRLFGEYNKKRFNLYCEAAIELKDVNENGLQLTPKGQRVIDRWRQYNDYIYDIVT